MMDLLQTQWQNNFLSQIGMEVFMNSFESNVAAPCESGTSTSYTENNEIHVKKRQKTSHNINNLQQMTSSVQEAPLNAENVAESSSAGEKDVGKNNSARRSAKGETRRIRLERQLKRNTGKEYTNVTGKLVTMRRLKELTPCRMKCKERFNDETRGVLFNEYWQMGDYNRRVQFIANLIEINEKMTSRPRLKNSNISRSRNYTFTYHLQVDGEFLSICKSCFMKTFDETNKFISNAVSKKLGNASGIVKPDRRGKTEFRNKKSINDKIEVARQHILSVPSYKSYYSKEGSDVRYLLSNYSIAKLYEEYRIKHTEGPVDRKTYEQAFHNLKLSIRKPAMGICQTCEKLQLQIKDANDNEEDKFRLSTNLETHQKDAEAALQAKTADIDASNNDLQTTIICFKMQRCLPTPVVSNTLAFYKRLLWTFNLSVHDCNKQQAYCYVWNESLAARDADDVASCLYKYLMSIPEGVKKVTMYSDTCGDQNKSSHFSVMCFVALQNSPTLCEIDHKFLTPGHSRTECDSDHALIEKLKKGYRAPIEHSHDWAQLFRLVGKKKPFKVTEMASDDFLEFSQLLKGPLQDGKLCFDNSNVKWKQVKWLHYEKQSIGTLFYKTSLNSSDDFQSVCWKRKRKSNPILIPRKKYSGSQAISEEKKKHLLELLPAISQTYWSYYQNLKTSKNIVDIHPDSMEEYEFEL